MKLIVVTNSKNFEKVVVEDKQTKILSYIRFTELKKIGNPVIFISNSNIEFVNIIFSKYYIDVSFVDKFLSKSKYLINNFLKSINCSYKLNSYEEILTSIIEMQRLLFNTFIYSLSLIYLKSFPKNAFEEFCFGKYQYKIIECIFLPPVSYAIIKEFKNIIGNNIDTYKEPRECFYLFLSYLFSDFHFFTLVKNSLMFLQNYNLSKTHSCFPTNTTKRSKIY